jgi:hypothetical protein
MVLGRDAPIERLDGSTEPPTWSLSLASSIGRSIREDVLREYVASAIDEAAQGLHRPEVPPMGAGPYAEP